MPRQPGPPKRQGRPHFERQAENRLLDTLAASHALARGPIYLRNFQALYAIREGGK